MSIQTQALIDHLDTLLGHVGPTGAPHPRGDVATNGLQVMTKKQTITTLAYAVDATTQTIQRAADNGADMLIVHHGIMRGAPMQPLVDYHYDRLHLLITHGIALYASHLPLDAHPTLGNNALLLHDLCDQLGQPTPPLAPCGIVDNNHYGYGIQLPTPITAAQLRMTAQPLGLTVEHRLSLPDDRHISSIACVSGQGGAFTDQAVDQGYDLLITGETKLSERLHIAEHGLGLRCAGHQETETRGVYAVAHHVAREYGVEIVDVQ